MARRQIPALGRGEIPGLAIHFFRTSRRAADAKGCAKGCEGDSHLFCAFSASFWRGLEIFFWPAFPGDSGLI